MRFISKRTLTGPVLGFLSCLVLVLLGFLVPLTVQFSLTRYLNNPGDYTSIQLPNIFWTTAEVGDRNFAAIFGLFHPLAITVAVMAAIAFIINLLVMPAAVDAARIATPQRVIQDDALQNPQPEESPQRSNPWE